MRLIDADELQERMLRYYGDYSFNICEEIRDFFQNTPTVKAIPIEFIKQLIEKFDCERGNAIKDTYAHILSALLEFWEFEQEEENEIS